MNEKKAEKRIERMFGVQFRMQLFGLNSPERIHSHIEIVLSFMHHLELKIEIFKEMLTLRWKKSKVFHFSHIFISRYF